MIILLADSAPHVGFGHIRRMMTLYDFLKNDFATSLASLNPPPSLIKEFQENNISYTSLKSLNHLELKEKNPNLNFIVFDGYDFSDKLINSFKEIGIGTMLVEDFSNCIKSPDIILNHSPGCSGHMYTGNYSLTGPQYSLVNPVFNTKNNYSYKRGQVMLSYGGVDPMGLSLPTLKALLNLEEKFSIYLLAGSEEKAKEIESQLLPRQRKEVEILSNIPAASVAKIMSTSEFGIFPASTIAMEACQTRLPIIVTQTSDNQELYRKGLVELCLAHYIEPKNLGSTKLLTCAIAQLRAQSSNLLSAQEYYFDGESKTRIINEINKFLQAQNEI